MSSATPKVIKNGTVLAFLRATLCTQDDIREFFSNEFFEDSDGDNALRCLVTDDPSQNPTIQDVVNFTVDKTGLEFSNASAGFVFVWNTLYNSLSLKLKNIFEYTPSVLAQYKYEVVDEESGDEKCDVPAEEDYAPIGGYIPITRPDASQSSRAQPMFPTSVLTSSAHSMFNAPVAVENGVSQAPQQAKVTGSSFDDLMSETSGSVVTESVANDVDFVSWINEIDPSWIHKYGITQLAITVRYIAQVHCKRVGAFDGGKQIKELDVQASIMKHLNASGVDIVLAAAINACSTSVGTGAMVPTADNYSSSGVKLLRNGTFHNENGLYLDVSLSPLLRVSKNSHFETVDPRVRDLFSELLCVVTTKGIRNSITLKGYVDGCEKTFVWCLHESILPLIPTSVTCDHASLGELAIRLVRKGLFRLVGNVSPGGHRKFLKTFLREVADSHVAAAKLNKYSSYASSVITTLSMLRTVRLQTLLDATWNKQEYYFLRAGEKIIPFSYTYFKFFAAFKNMIPEFQKYAATLLGTKPSERFLVIYGGVTMNGKNTQFTAAQKFFKKLFGQPFTNSSGDICDEAKWNLASFDLVGNQDTGTFATDASKISSVHAVWNKVVTKYNRYIVILDLADDSVTEKLNDQVPVWMENFMALPKKPWFITSKYCVTAELTVTAGTIGALTTKLGVSGDYKIPGAAPVKDNDGNETVPTYSFPVGRGHGVEGIVLVTPGNTKYPATRQTMLPFITAQQPNGDPHYAEAFHRRLIDSSFNQMAPATFCEIDAEYADYLPTTFNNQARKGGNREDGVEAKIAGLFTSENLFHSD